MLTARGSGLVRASGATAPDTAGVLTAKRDPVGEIGLVVAAFANAAPLALPVSDAAGVATVDSRLTDVFALNCPALLPRCPGPSSLLSDGPSNAAPNCEGVATGGKTEPVDTPTTDS